MLTCREITVGGATVLASRISYVGELGWELYVSFADAAALRQLDRSAAEVRSALAQNPDARFLLDRLQKLYAQRLALTQRLALS